MRQSYPNPNFHVAIVFAVESLLKMVVLRKSDLVAGSLQMPEQNRFCFSLNYC